MRVSDVVRQADLLRPNTLAPEIKASWVEEVDADVEEMMLDVRGVEEAVRNYSRGIYDKRMLSNLVNNGTITPLDYRAITCIPDTEDIVSPCREKWYPEEDCDLLLPKQYEEVYVLYVVSKIDYYNQEADLYQNDKRMFSERWREAQAWWRRNNRARRTGEWRV